MRQVRLPMKNIKVTDNRIRGSKKTDEEYAQLKKSIKQLGLSNPVIVTTDLELISGFWRLKAFIELHNEEPDNEGYLDIPTLIVTPKEEAEDLKIDFMDGKSSDYMRDTAVDRLNIIYEPIEFKDKPLYEFLDISKTEFEHRLKIGQKIRRQDFSDGMIEKYRKDIFTHSFLYNWLKEQEEFGDVEEPVFYGSEIIEAQKEAKKFDISKWI